MRYSNTALRFGSILLALSGVLVASAAEDLRMKIEPLFAGQTGPSGAWPLAIDIDNVGPDARGILELNSSGLDLAYPVDLPRGAHKRIISYPDARSFYGTAYSLQTNRGSITKPFDPRLMPAEVGSQPILLITENSGELSFVRDPGKEGKSQLVDTYCRPEDAPGRLNGYGGMFAVVLGAGSERLNDAAVDALRLWVLSGGTVVFIGGASSPVLADHRWDGLMPVVANGVATVLRPSAFFGYTSEPIPEPFTVTSFKAQAGAISGTPFVVEKPFGIGKAVFLAADPFESPLNRWEGRRRLIERIVRPIDKNLASAFLNTYSGEGDQYSYSGSSYPGPSYPGTPISSYGSASSDPFSTKLPPTRRVFLILGLYFLAVVPLNMLVLRKLKRGELAWVTAPLISVGFAALLLSTAKDLYSARLSTASQGVLLEQEGVPQAVFIGRTQMFFPSGGRYDLKLEGVQRLANTAGMRYGSFGADVPESIEAVDVGQIIVPSLPVDNLSFREISYTQALPQAAPLEVRLDASHGSATTCHVRNLGSSELRNPKVVCLSREYPFKNLKPGDEASVRIVSNGSAGVKADGRGNQDVAPFVKNGRLAVTGDLQGFLPGPQVGSEVVERRLIKLAYLTNLRFGGKSK